MEKTWSLPETISAILTDTLLYDTKSMRDRAIVHNTIWNTDRTAGAIVARVGRYNPISNRSSINSRTKRCLAFGPPTKLTLDYLFHLTDKLPLDISQSMIRAGVPIFRQQLIDFCEARHESTMGVNLLNDEIPKKYKRWSAVENAILRLVAAQTADVGRSQRADQVSWVLIMCGFNRSSYACDKQITKLLSDDDNVDIATAHFFDVCDDLNIIGKLRQRLWLPDKKASKRDSDQKEGTPFRSAMEHVRDKLNSVLRNFNTLKVDLASTVTSLEKQIAQLQQELIDGADLITEIRTCKNNEDPNQ